MDAYEKYVNLPIQLELAYPLSDQTAARHHSNAETGNSRNPPLQPSWRELPDAANPAVAWSAARSFVPANWTTAAHLHIAD